MWIYRKLTCGQNRSQFTIQYTNKLLNVCIIYKSFLKKEDPTPFN